MRSSTWERIGLAHKPNGFHHGKRSRTIKGIKYVSLHEYSGYGNAARAYLRGLMKSGIPLTWAPMVRGSAWGLGYEPFLEQISANDELSPICNKPIEYDTVIVHTVPEYYPLWKEREPGKQLIGYTVWETTRIPDHWRDLLNAVDRLMVPCEWNRQVFTQCGVTTPIEVIPHILEDLSVETCDISWEIPEEDFVFYTIGTWTARKAIPDLIRCYLNTFNSRHRTTLVIKTSARDYTQGRWMQYVRTPERFVRRILATYPDPARIRLITEPLREAEISCLHHRGDCFVSLCHSEGWGLGAFNAAGLGKPIIITGFGGHVEFLPEELAHLVNYRMVPVVDHQGRTSYSPNQAWAKPDPDHASHLMKLVFSKKAEAQEKGKKLAEHIQQRFNEKKVIKKLIASL